MNYLPYKTKFMKEKITSSSTLDFYLTSLGFNKETINLILNPPKENDYHLMHDLDKMVEEISTMNKSNVITIVSDYDADGCTSNAILYLVLKELGLTVHYYVPHRIHDGYGLSTSIVDKIKVKWPDTDIIMTCDNGIAAVEAVKYAKDCGYKVFVTDHHTPDMNNLPTAADYIVHPALPGYPFAEISGATVAYKIAKALIERNNIQNEELSEYILQLAAISVVSDVMPVAHKEIELMSVNENRTILKEGMNLMRTKPNWHLRIMFDMFKIQGETLDETTIGFYIAPLINAVGRLDNAAEAVAFLVADNQNDAIIKGAIMGYLNDERKEIKKTSLEMIQKNLDTSKPAIIAKAEEIHEGIVGIIAGNLCEQNQKPAIVFAKCTVNETVTETIDGEQISKNVPHQAWKASARSIDGINLYELLKEIKDENPEYIYTFGGHAGAAGLTVLDEYINNFEQAFNDKVQALGTIENNKYYLNIIASEVENFGKMLEEIKPLGNGLPKPIIRTNMFINQYDFFFSSGHVKLSNCFKNELWLYNSLDEFLSNDKHFDEFNKTMDNTEKIMQNQSISRREAKQKRWERWESNKGSKPMFDCILELDYGTYMGNVGPILSVIECNKK